MPSITLVTGPAASGKTSAAVAFLAERYRADPFFRSLVLVPTTRHADQFRQRLVAACGVSFNLSVLTPGQFSEAALPNDWKVASAEVVDALLEMVLEDLGEQGALGYLAPLAGRHGLVPLVARGMDPLFAEGLRPAAFAGAAAGDQRLESLSAAFTALGDALQERKLVHPSHAPAAAAEQIPARQVDIPAAFVVDGFRTFSGGEVALVRTLAAHATETIVTMDPDAGPRPGHDTQRLREALPGATVETLAAPVLGTPLRAGEAAGREDEVRAVARHIKATLAADTSLRPSAVAVGVRQSAPYIRLFRQVFAEFDLPLDIAGAERLSERPLGAWVTRLLRLGNPDWRVKDILAVVRSGYFDSQAFNLGPGIQGVVAESARRSRVWGGDDLRARLEAAINRVRENASARERQLRADAADSISRAIVRLETIVMREDNTLGAHAARLAVDLFGDDGIVPASVREDVGCRAEVDALQRTLLSLQSADLAVGGGTVSFSTFAERLLAAMERPNVQIREAGGVLLAPLHTLLGLRFAEVAILGLADGEFPAPRPRPPLLGLAQRDHLALRGLVLPPDARASELELWRAAKTRATRGTTAWRTRFDDKKRERAASSFFAEALAAGGEVERPSADPAHAGSRRELLLACVRDWPTAGRPREFEPWFAVREAAAVERQRRSFGAAGGFEGELLGSDLPFVTDETVWSASKFETYKTCPFQYFSSYVLGLRVVDEEMEEPDAAIAGTVVHRIMEALLTPLAAAGERLDAGTLPRVLANLNEVATRAWDQAADEYGFIRKGIWAARLPRTRDELRLLLENEAGVSTELGVEAIHGAESKFKELLPSTPPRIMTGSVDRVDWGDGIAVVVDYKSSSNIVMKDVTEGNLLQLQLYGAVMKEKLEAERVVGRYALLRARAGTSFQIDSAKEPEVFENALRVAESVAEAAGAGAFHVNPRPSDCPTYCSFKDSCRVNQFSRWKWPDA